MIEEQFVRISLITLGICKSIEAETSVMSLLPFLALKHRSLEEQNEKAT